MKFNTESPFLPCKVFDANGQEIVGVVEGDTDIGECTLLLADPGGKPYNIGQFGAGIYDTTILSNKKYTTKAPFAPVRVIARFAAPLRLVPDDEEGKAILDYMQKKNDTPSSRPVARTAATRKLIDEPPQEPEKS